MKQSYVFICMYTYIHPSHSTRSPPLSQPPSRYWQWVGYSCCLQHQTLNLPWSSSSPSLKAALPTIEQKALQLDGILKRQAAILFDCCAYCVWFMNYLALFLRLDFLSPIPVSLSHLQPYTLISPLPQRLPMIY